MHREEKWKAVSTNDESYDGKFYYGVKSTGIFCRPSCKSKLPKEENITYFDTKDEAISAGYRPCKRCRPDLIDYQPVQELARDMKNIIDRGFLDKSNVFNELKKLGVSSKRSIEIFKEEFDLTPGEYADKLRLDEARILLFTTDIPIIEIAYELGFESISAFYTFFGKYHDISPREYRSKKLVDEDIFGESISTFVYDTRLGRISITADDSFIKGLKFGEPSTASILKNSKLTDLAAEQLEEYFNGRRDKFDLPINPSGSEFQRSVWSSLLEIPYGATKSYKQVAESMGKSGASRAVGMANNKNPILIIIPCHQVVGSDGSLVGYAAGLAIKQQLLDLEKKYINNL